MPGRGRKWRSLENTAKIFPATSGKKDERVFRISCQMKEAVEPEKLQRALDLCVEDYALFLWTLLELSGGNSFKTGGEGGIQAALQSDLCPGSEESAV